MFLFVFFLLFFFFFFCLFVFCFFFCCCLFVFCLFVVVFFTCFCGEIRKQFILITSCLDLCELWHFQHIIWEMRKILVIKHMWTDLCRKKYLGRKKYLTNFKRSEFL